ncbi:MAG: restriction endonuclease [Spirochaetia bacterium]|nr:restriction endonuclease [Spirochaetia bacterium]
MKDIANFPTYDDFFNPLLKALRNLGGSGNIKEINEEIIHLMDLPDEITSVTHGDGTYSTEVEYRIAWARTYLKRYGLLENSRRGVWALVTEKSDVKTVDAVEVKSFVRELDKLSRKDAKGKSKNKKNSEMDETPDVTEEHDWKDEVISAMQAMTPDAFERLIQRVLREAGCEEVKVTGRSGDNGIDGKGIYSVGGLLSFHLLFQCKRYQGSVGPSEIRDFRGALQGRADKGLFITTGKFTQSAKDEATRDGAPPIDLIDGSDLSEKLKELQLGLKTEMVEKVTVDAGWFERI